MASVELRNVSKVYDGNVVAVNSADLFIEDKEFVVLVGPSGCGKSTLLRMIAGLEEISSGELYIDGERMNEVPPKDRDIAMVFQNYALYPHMSVYDNMAFGLKLRKFPKDEIDQRVHDAAEILGIRSLLARKPKALSGGQRQRVAVGRAIVRKPKVFLFDEPLSNLDAKLRVQMRTEISKLHSKLQTTMIYVTHDQVEAMTMGNRIVVLKDGFMQQVDSPLNLYNDPANQFVAGFIGSPSMNFIRGKLCQETQLSFQKNGVILPIPETRANALRPFVNKDIVMGIRPEHLTFLDNETTNKEKAFFQATIEVVEPMGNEIYLYVRLDNDAVTARIAPRSDLKVDSTCSLSVDMTKAHFFDDKNEKRIN